MAQRHGKGMAKLARRYDIYLPVTYNDGTRIPGEKYDDVEDRLLRHFGGLTSQRREFPFRGKWQEGSNVYEDRIVVLTVIDFRRGGSTRFVGQLKADLLEQFKQLEILITETALRVH
jgi:hypothetical protein